MKREAIGRYIRQAWKTNQKRYLNQSWKAFEWMHMRSICLYLDHLNKEYKVCCCTVLLSRTWWVGVGIIDACDIIKIQRNTIAVEQLRQRAEKRMKWRDIILDNVWMKTLFIQSVRIFSNHFRQTRTVFCSNVIYYVVWPWEIRRPHQF